MKKYIGVLTSVIILVITLNGCYDVFYGPMILNDFKHEIKIKIHYSNSIQPFECLLKPQTTLFQNKDNLIIQEILIYQGDIIIKHFKKEQLKQLQQDKNFKNLIIKINENGISLVNA